MDQRQRLAVIVLALAVLVVGFVVASGSKDDDKGSSTAATATTTATTATTGTSAGTTTTTTAAAPATPAAPVVRVTGGKPAGGIKKLSFAKGDDVRFTVASDVADEIHVHGYDFKKDVPAGGRVTFDFPAKIDGIFEIELEGAGVQIAELKVKP